MQECEGFIKDADCTKDTPLMYGELDIPIYGTGKRIIPRVEGRRDSSHFEKIFLPELLPLEEYDLVAILLSGGNDGLGRYKGGPHSLLLQTAGTRGTKRADGVLAP